jgi:hypothetical protein
MNSHLIPRTRAALALLFGIGCLVAGGVRADMSRTIDLHRAADAQGTVEIQNVAGSVDVKGWDKAEVSVTGHIGDKVDKVELSGEGGRTSIHVVLPTGSGWSGNGEAELTVHVPRKSRLSISFVSADLTIGDVQGEVEIHTVSGDIHGAVGGDLHVNTVSGDVQLDAPGAKIVEIKSTSGDVSLNGASGDVNVTSVSGDLQLKLGALTRGHFQTISGDVNMQLGFASGAQLEASSISGDLHFDFAAAPDADVDAVTLSGDISSCFGGARPSRPQYGPGERLSMRSGDGKGRIRIETKSGDISLCTPGGKASASAIRPVVYAANVLGGHRVVF